MKHTLRRALTTAAAAFLLGLGGAALATPAHAEVDGTVLGGLATVHDDGSTDVGVLGTNLVHLPNPLEGSI
ncbi:hypothetical protein [Streptomyces hesseae]|uniref:Chaplin domain-containing protein n=1 Tax=Streptomyces hesseae TaxID=3075519 RepID=A0ABU2STI9_9ACTN|nr:hypothetical protein [Streptomyces sp. DSM 40473]MDT0452319.1 hypothetical protein [Streptomyces sp. DSM 40473]